MRATTIFPCSTTPEASTLPQTDWQERLHQAEVLLDVTASLSVHDTLDAMLTSLIEVTTAAVGAEQGAILIHDDRTDELCGRSSIGKEFREISMPSTQGIAGHVFITGTGLVVNDPDTETTFLSEIDWSVRTRNVICAPMALATGERLGVAQCINKRNATFDACDLNLLLAMLHQAAGMLRLARLLEAMRRAHTRDERYLEMATHISPRISHEDLFGTAMRYAAHLLDGKRARLFLHDAKRTELWSRMNGGPGAPEVRISDSSGIPGHVFWTGETVNLPPHPPGVPDRRSRNGSLLCVPVIGHRGRALGVVEVLKKSAAASAHRMSGAYAPSRHRWQSL